MEKIIIEYHKESHHKAIAAQIEKRDTFEALQIEVIKHVKLLPKELPLLKANCWKYFQTAFLKKHEDKNVLQLSFGKLVELMEVDVSKVAQLCDKYASMATVNEDAAIKESDYTVYATTPEQIARWHDAKNLVDALLKIKEKYRPALGLMTFQSATLDILRFDMGTNSIKPNSEFVLKGH